MPQTMDWSRSSHGIGQSLPEQIRVVHPLTTSIFIECGPRVRHGTHTYRRDQLAQAVRECGNSCATVGSGSPSFLLVQRNHLSSTNEFPILAADKTSHDECCATVAQQLRNSCATVGSGSPSFLLVSQTTSVAETLQSDSQEPPQLTEKQQSARSIKPGCRIIQARAGQERMAGLHQIQAWIDVAQRRTPTTLAFR